MSEHTSKQFDAELESVRSQVLQMGGLVEEQITRAMESLITGDLELIGDEAAKIARMAKLIHAAERLHMPRMDLSRVADRALAMLRQSLDAFARLDVPEAMQVVKQDQAVDDEFRAIMRQLITFMMEDPRTITRSLEILFIAKAVERIGDHAKNMAEYVVYMVKGRDVRHIAIEQVEKEILE